MATGGLGIKALVLLVTALLCACGSGGGGTARDPAAQEGSFDDDVRAACAETAEVEADQTFSENEAAIQEDLDQILDAHVELQTALADLDPPSDRADAFDAYLAELESYVAAMKQGHGASDDRDRLQGLVDGAESGIELREHADDAALPDECPPSASTNVHNTLFVTEANLGCFDLGKDVLSAGPPKTPESPKEVALVLELGARVSGGIAGVIRGADSPGVEDIPVDELVAANKARFEAVKGLARTFTRADFGAYKRAAKRLEEVSKRADELALSVGLIHCAEVFSLLPF